MKNNNNLRKKSLTAVMVSLLLILAIAALNVGAAFIPQKFALLDITSSKLYTISDETKKFVGALDEVVTLSIIDADGSNSQFEIFMERYAQSGKNLSVEYVSTLSDPDFLSSHGISSSDTVYPYSIMVSSEKRSQLIDFYSMYYYYNENLGKMSYSDYNYYYALFSSSESYADYLYELMYNTQLYFCGELALTTMVEYVTLDHIPHSYFITGRGEDSAYDGNFASLLSSENMAYEYGILDITTATSIPEDADCLMINSPSEDYTDAETQLIMDYLKDGGRLLLITGKDNTSMPNLMSIAEYYGATTTDALVAQDQASADTNEETDESSAEGESETEYDKYTLSPVINTEHDVFASFPEDEYVVNISNSTAITVSDQLRDAQLVTPILTTSDSAYTSDPETKGVCNLGVAIEEETDSGTTRLVWFTGADSFNNDEANNINLSLLVYAMSWMGESYESVLGDISIPLFEDPMLIVSSGVAVTFGIFLILLIPVALITTGIVIYVKRRGA